MTKKTRSLLLIILALAFVVITPIIVMFSQGYRFDLSQRKLVQTGAIFLKTKPEEITLSLDGKEKAFKKSTLIYNGILLGNLIPQPHSLTLWSDDEHFDWKKNLSVEPLLVAKATRVVLPWRNPKATNLELSSSSLEFSLGLDNNQILYSSDSRQFFTFIPSSATSTPFLDLNQFSSFAPQEKITEILPSAFQRNFLALSQNQGLLKTETKEILLSSYLRNILSQFRLRNLRFSWHPQNDNSLFVMTPGSIYWADLGADQLQLILDSRARGFSQTKQANHYLTEEGALYNFNLNNPENPELVFQFEPDQLKNRFYWIYPVNNDFLLWSENGQLLYLDPEQKTVKEINAAVKLFEFSSDESRIAYLDTASQVHVYFLEEVFDDIKYGAGEQLDLQLPLANSALTKIYFANDNWYLVLVAPDRVLISEIDKRSPLNYWEPEIKSSLYPLSFDRRNNELSWTDKTGFWNAELMP